MSFVDLGLTLLVALGEETSSISLEDLFNDENFLSRLERIKTTIGENGITPNDEQVLNSLRKGRRKAERKSEIKIILGRLQELEELLRDFTVDELCVAGTLSDLKSDDKIREIQSNNQEWLFKRSGKNKNYDLLHKIFFVHPKKIHFIVEFIYILKRCSEFSVAPRLDEMRVKGDVRRNTNPELKTISLY